VTHDAVDRPARHSSRPGHLLDVAWAHPVIVAILAAVVIGAGFSAGVLLHSGGTPAHAGAVPQAYAPGPRPAGVRTIPSVAWRLATPSTVPTPSVIGGYVILVSGTLVSGTHNGKPPATPAFEVVSLATGRVLWSVTGSRLNGWVAVGTDRVVLSLDPGAAGGNTLEMRELADGDIVWHTAGGGGGLRLIGPYVLVAGHDSDDGLDVLDVATGAHRWSRPGEWLADPGQPDTVYAWESTTLREIDLATGSVLASAPMPAGAEPQEVITGPIPVLVVPSPAAPFTTVGYAAHGLRTLWTATEIGFPQPSYSSDMLVAWDATAIARLDPLTGHEIWSHDGRPGADTPNVTVIDQPSIIDTRSGSTATGIEAIDPDSGRQQWSVVLPAANNSYVEEAADVTYVYQSTNATESTWRLYALDSATGKRLWSEPNRQSPFASTPVAVDHGILVCTDSGLELLTA
jgi:outer membrane protein assembly factor BamB